MTTRFPADGPGSDPRAAVAEFALDPALARAIARAAPTPLPWPLALVGFVAAASLLPTVIRAPSLATATTIAATLGFFAVVAGLSLWQARATRVKTATAWLVEDHPAALVRAAFDDVGLRITIGDEFGYALPWTEVHGVPATAGLLALRFRSGQGFAIPLSALGDQVDRVRALAATGAAIARDRAAAATPPAP